MVEDFVLEGYDAVVAGNWFPNLQRNIVFPSSRVRRSERNYSMALCCFKTLGTAI